MQNRPLQTFYALFLLSLMMWAGSAFAQAKQLQLKIRDVSATYGTVERYIRVWDQGEDPFAVPAETILSGAYDDQFQPLPDSSNRLQPKRSYWAKLVIDYQAERDADWLLKVGQNNYIEAYIQTPDGQYVTKKAGFFHSIKEKDLPESRDGEFALSLHAGERQVIYLHVWDEANYRVKFEMSLKPLQRWYDHVKALNLGQGLLLGALLIMLAYNLLVYLLSRDKAYLYYSGYIFFGALYYANRAGFTREYFFQDSVSIWQSLWVYAIALQPPFYLLFMRKFLNTSVRMPRFDKVILGAIIAMLLGAAIQLSIFYSTFNLNLLIYFSIAQSMLSYIFLLVCLFAIIRIKDKLYRYFLLGSSVFFAGSFIGTGMLVLNKGMGADFMPYVQAGFLGEIILFSVGLGYRIRRNEQDKQQAQQDLIAQLKANEELQQKVNRELEDKVKERTQELEMQKEEIEAQRDNIEAAYEEIQAKNETIEKKNQDITASINYAKRIQTAILPSESKIVQSFEDAFVIFYPRDIVSGDFYWHASVEGYRVIAAVDCTGHGVPGAIMSMIGNDLLTEAIHLKGLRDAAEVLEYADMHLKERLQQESDTSIPDGMDMSLCIIDDAKKEVSFAGAKNPMIWVENGEMREVKGTRRPIGGQEKKRRELNPFVSHKLSFDGKEVVFYLFSDGYQDQFGGPSGRKFMKRRLRGLLGDLCKLPLPEQKSRLENMFRDWKRGERQIDDVLLLGIKL